jgi:hypothetical protein
VALSTGETVWRKHVDQMIARKSDYRKQVKTTPETATDGETNARIINRLYQFSTESCYD